MGLGSFDRERSTAAAILSVTRSRIRRAHSHTLGALKCSSRREKGLATLCIGAGMGRRDVL